MVNNSVDAALANGWKPVLRPDGGLDNRHIPEELKGLASPKAHQKIRDRLAYHNAPETVKKLMKANKLPQAADDGKKAKK